MNVRDAMTWQLASGYHAPHRNLVRARGIEDSDVQQRAIRTLRRCVVVGVLEDLPRFYDAVDEFFGKVTPRPSRLSDTAASAGTVRSLRSFMIDTPMRLRWRVTARSRCAAWPIPYA